MSPFQGLIIILLSQRLRAGLNNFAPAGLHRVSNQLLPPVVNHGLVVFSAFGIFAMLADGDGLGIF